MSLIELTATEAVKKLKSGDLAPTEYLQELLDHIEKTEPDIQAWEAIDADAAMDTAKALEKKRQNRYPTQPLYGVPFGIKDLLHARGLPTTANFGPWKNNVQHEDSAVAQYLKDAGGVLIGKQVTTQWGTMDPSQSRNPWNLDRTPGGSSAGTGAAVGARHVPFGIGTQASGSNNRPAAYCGAAAIKPTFGRISRYGNIGGSWTQGHPGVIARSVADLALVLTVLARHDPRDPFSAIQKQENYVAAIQRPRPPRVGLITDMMERSEPSVRASTEKSIQMLKDAGAEIQEVQLPFSLDVLLSAHTIIGMCDRGTAAIEIHAKHAEDYRPVIRSSTEIAHLVPTSVYLQTFRLRRRFRHQIMDLFGEDLDGFIAPTSSNLPPERTSSTGDASFQQFGTFFGFPITSIPTEVGEQGLPHAIQLVGRPFDDALLLQLSAWCESVFDPIGAPPLI